MITITEIKEYTPHHLAAVRKLMEQLTLRSLILTEESFKQLIANENSHLFLLLKERDVAGMLTVGIYQSPTGSKAWIEDVVIDESFRKQGLSKLLMAHAIQFSQSKGIDSLMLTSKPQRIAANQLYRAIGFEPKETNVYQMKLRK